MSSAAQKRSISLAAKLIAVVLTIILVVVAVNYAVFTSSFKSTAQDMLLQKAQQLASNSLSTQSAYDKMTLQGHFDLETMLEEVEEKRAASSGNFDYTQVKLWDAVPVVAAWEAGEKAAAEQGFDFTAVAFDARNPDNDPTNDPDADSREFRTNLLRELEAQVASGGAEEIYAVNTRTNTFHHMRAIQLSESCMMCHGKPGGPNDPNNDGLDPLGFPMEDWVVGDYRGAFETQMPLAKLDKQVAGFMGSGLMATVPLVIIGGVGFVFLLRRMFTKPIADIVSAVQEIASGKLKTRLEVKSNDELGTLSRSVNDMTENLAEVISEVQASSNEVAGAATQIASGAEEMAAGMEEQRRQTSQVSAAVEQMSASVTEVAEKATGAAKRSDEGGEQAVKGGQIVQETIGGMNAISEQVNESVRSVGELGRRSEQIGEIIEVINDIADQTNLLALNAAIEAARAGEHGRGFAVVADEVRKLAERTTKATEEVADSIRAIQEETAQAVERMEAGKTRVDEGVQLAQNAGSALEQIVAGAREIAPMIQGIAAAAEQQSSAANEISGNVERINAVTNESADGVNQVAQAAGTLSQKAETLQGLVRRFEI
jgi:methyl-accepting chemotaxis protein